MTSARLHTTSGEPSLPGPPPMPVFGPRGNFFHFLKDPLAYVSRVVREHGRLAALARGSTKHIIAVGPEFNQPVLSDARFHAIFEEVTPERMKRLRRSKGLLNMNGEEHKQQRRLMLPAFHRKQVEAYRDMMVDITRQMLDGWSTAQRLDIAQEMRTLALRVACKTLFGLDVDEGHAGALGLMVKQMLQINPVSPGVVLFPFDLPGTPFRRLMRVGHSLEDEILALIARRRASPGEHHDVLSMLIQARDDDGTQMKDPELVGQANILLVAGHETTANALSWTLFLLTQHPRIYGDLMDELHGVLRGAPPSLEHLRADTSRLPLLDGVIKEGLRLMPPATLLSRISTMPFDLGSHHFPSGSIVTLSVHHTHRMPELFPEPLRFDPERWRTLDPSPYEYIPFGAGPRMCIGATFAQMELKLILPMMLQRFRFDVVPNIPVNYHIKMTLSPRGGLPMVLAPPSSRFSRMPVAGNIREMVDLS